MRARLRHRRLEDAVFFPHQPKPTPLFRVAAPVYKPQPRRPCLEPELDAEDKSPVEDLPEQLKHLLRSLADTATEEERGVISAQIARFLEQIQIANPALNDNLRENLACLSWNVRAWSSQPELRAQAELTANLCSPPANWTTPHPRKRGRPAAQDELWGAALVGGFFFVTIFIYIYIYIYIL